MILTLDLGTSTTKAVVWDDDGPRAVGRATVTTSFPAGDRAEQDPAAWWPAVVAACAEARSVSPRSFGAVDAVGFAAARQTFVPVTAAGQPLGPALVWSDRRASAEARALVDALGGTDAVRRRTGGVLDGSAVAAKASWLATHDPDRLVASRWLLTPRDLVVWRMTGEVVTDTTMISAAGLCDATGAPVADLVAAVGDRLPPVLAPDAVAGAIAPVRPPISRLPAGVPVVVGAGRPRLRSAGHGGIVGTAHGRVGHDGQCLGAGRDCPDPPPAGVIATRRRHRRLAARGRPLGRRVARHLVVGVHRSRPRRLDGQSRRFSRRRPRRRRPALVRRGPGSLVAGPARWRLRGPEFRPRRRRPGPCRGRVGGLGGRALPRGHRLSRPRWPDDRRCGHGG